jgi:hypothetical protein
MGVRRAIQAHRSSDVYMNVAAPQLDSDVA